MECAARTTSLISPFLMTWQMISSEPDARSDELNALYRDERVRVPRTVFNAELKELQEL
jgi:hypothetical protein